MKITEMKSKRYNVSKEIYNYDGSLENKTSFIKHLNAKNEKDCLLKGQVPLEKAKTRKNKKVDGLKHTSKEELSAKTVDTFNNMKLALESNDINTYYEVGSELIIRKAVKLLNRVNIIPDKKDYADILQEARTTLWLELNQWKPYTREEDIAGVPTKVTYEAISELLTYHDAEVASRILFYVLADRTQRSLRKYIFASNNLNTQIALESIAESASEEDILEQIELKIDRYTNIEKIQNILTRGQYKALTEYLNGKKANQIGVQYADMKQAIRNGLINPEELRSILPAIKSKTIPYDVQEKLAFETRKGLAQVLKKLG